MVIECHRLNKYTTNYRLEKKFVNREVDSDF